MKRFAPYLIVAVCACASSQAVLIPSPRIYKGNTLPNAYAYTKCDTTTNVSYVVIDTSAYGKAEWNYLLVHEMKHVEQASRYKGGCKAYSKHYAADNRFALEQEVEAECAELAVRAEEGENYEQGIFHITHYYGEHYRIPSFEWLEAHVRIVCADERNAVRRR